ncbi:MAG: Bax inhibitor-1/YccA family protein [Holosporales bacterium]|jgi:FtsH-binding integral membrane protein|nr:Bax inhibitor-1/YccA family protein [Holosporales bacterium]
MEQGHDVMLQLGEVFSEEARMMRREFEDGPIIVGDSVGGIKKYMTFVYNRMFAALCLTGLVALVCGANDNILRLMTGGFAMLLMIATIAIVMYLTARINSIDASKASALFWIYSALIGASVSPVLMMYTGESIATAFFMTALFFGGMSLYGRFTQKNLTGMGSFMFVGLITVVVASIANVFMGSSRLQIGLSALSVIIFCGLTAYDAQRIALSYNDSDSDEVMKKKAICGALSLYLDFINIFLALLRIMGRRR